MTGSLLPPNLLRLGAGEVDALIVAHLRALAHGSSVESETVDLKRLPHHKTPPKKRAQADLARIDVTALANKRGGHLIIGVDEDSGVVHGVADVDDALQWYARELSRNIEPPLSTDVYPVEMANGTVVVVACGASVLAPHAVLGTAGHEGCSWSYERVGPANSPLTPQRLARLLAARHDSEEKAREYHSATLHRIRTRRYPQLDFPAQPRAYLLVQLRPAHHRRLDEGSAQHRHATHWLAEHGAKSVINRPPLIPGSRRLPGLVVEVPHVDGRAWLSGESGASAVIQSNDVPMRAQEMRSIVSRTSFGFDGVCELVCHLSAAGLLKSSTDERQRGSVYELLLPDVTALASPFCQIAGTFVGRLYDGARYRLTASIEFDKCVLQFAGRNLVDNPLTVSTPLYCSDGTSAESAFTHRIETLVEDLSVGGGELGVWRPVAIHE